MKTVIIIGTLLLIGQVSIAQQSKIERADQLYNLLAFSEAIPEYESALSQKSSNQGELSLKLAKSYYFFGDIEKSRNYFSDAEGLKVSFSAEDCFIYSQCFKQSGDYVNADLWMKKYETLKPGTPSVIDFNKNPDYLASIRSEQKHFSIATVTFNSRMNDFGGYEYKKTNTIFIVSDRNSSPVKRIYGWNSMNFLDFLVVSNNNKGKTTINAHRSGNSKSHEGPLCFTADESRVFYTSNNNGRSTGTTGQKGLQNSDLYKAQILPDGEIGAPVNLGQMVNTEKQELFPWFSPEGQLFFSSNGFTGLGGLDIFVANLSAGEVKAVKHTGPEINSPKDDFGLIFSTNGKKGYFSSNRDGGQGNDDIYSFELIAPFNFSLQLTGQITDIATGAVLKETEVALLDESGNIIQTVLSDEKGNYKFDLEPGQKYAVSFTQKGYTDVQKVVKVDPQAQNVKVDAAMAKVPTFGLLCKITEAESGNVLQGVSVQIVEPQSGKIIMDEITSPEGLSDSGLENVKIGDQLNLKVTISKEGYLSKTVDLSLKITKEGIYNVHEMIDASLGKIEVGVDLATLIDIKPIYFDLGKYTIRKDASVELDKIVKIMNEYPSMQIELGSHTDCRGSIASNETLSSNRAKASAEYIKKRINNPERIYGKGYGESKLKVDCPCEGAVKSACPETEHQKNRRTEFLIIKM